jgi:hypothetical protein
MRTSKAVFPILLMTVFVFLAGSPSVYAAAGVPNPWPLTPGAKGQTFYGTLVIVYTPTGGCCVGSSLFCFDPEVTMTFHLTLYKNRENSWSFASEDSTPYCLLTGVCECVLNDCTADECQQVALLAFLQNEVLPGLKGGKFRQIFLKEVANEYSTGLVGAGPPDYTIADVTIVAK